MLAGAIPAQATLMAMPGPVAQADASANVFVVHDAAARPMEGMQPSKCPKLHRPRPLSTFPAISDEQQTFSGCPFFTHRTNAFKCHQEAALHK